MSTKKVDSGKKGQDSNSGQRVPVRDTGEFVRKDEKVIVPAKKDSGGTESTGPKKK